MITLLKFIFVSAISLLSSLAISQSISNDPFICPPCGDGSCDNTLYQEAGTCPVCGMALIKKSRMKNVAIFIHDGVEILDFSGPGEVFAASRPEGGAFNVYTVSLSTDPIISQGFVKVIPEYSIENAPRPDILVLPGGNTGPVSENPHLIQWIQEIAPDLDIALSVCTGAFILHKAGLLDGKKATTWHGAIANLKRVATRTEVLENIRWVDNGQVITTAGVSAGIDGALHVVEKIFDRKTAEATAQYMEYDKWKPEEGLIVEKN
jgi:transcriptional regulator GlxA family with amidase domain